MAAIPLDANWQLFLDNYAVARTPGLDRVVHHPRSMGVVLPADRPWETVGAAPVHVERDSDGQFHAFYMAMWWDSSVAQTSDHPGFRVDRAHHSRGAVAYARSDDGIHWDKPDLGLADAPGGVDMRNAPFPEPAGATRDNTGYSPIRRR